MPDITKITGVTRANAYNIPPEQLRHVENSRRWDDTDVAELALDMAELLPSGRIRGQLVPIAVDWDEDGNLIVVDGRRRVAAIRYGNESGLFVDERGEVTLLKVRCELFKGDKSDTFTSAVVTNTKRKPLSPIDLAHSISTLEKEGKARKEIAKLLEISESLISKTLKLLNLPAGVQKDIHKGKISFDAGYEMANDPAEAETTTEETGTATETASGAASGRSSKGRKSAGEAAKPTRESIRKSRRERAERGEATSGSTSRSRKEVRNLFVEWAGCQDGTLEEPIMKFAATLVKYMDGEVGDRAVLNRLRELAGE